MQASQRDGYSAVHASAKAPARTSSGTIRGCRSGISILLGAYVLVAVGGNLMHPQGEVFPVFSWSLFSQVHNPARGVELEILEIDGERFAEPRGFFTLPERFVHAARNNMDVNKAVVSFMTRLRAGEDTTRLRRRIEAVYLGEAERVRWQVSVVAFDPLERHRSGAILGRHVLFDSAGEARP